MISNMNKYAIKVLLPEPTMVAKIYSSIYFYIIWLFCFRVTLNLTYDSILCIFSQKDFFASIKR